MGICLGMQLFFKNSSEYGKTRGLNLINKEVKKFPKGKNSKLPNIGWSKVNNLKSIRNKIFKDVNGKNHFYFVHSYYVKSFTNNNFQIGYSNNNKIDFCSFVNFKNLYLFQFHPEKSSLEGLKIYRNFKNLL